MSVASAGWSRQQRCYRELMKGLRAAYFGDRASLFWARHRVLVEFYKYAEVQGETETTQLIGIGHEVAEFFHEHMKLSVERIVRHNEAMMLLSPAEAKRYRADYLSHEAKHASWCKQKIKQILQRRPPPPYPFI